MEKIAVFPGSFDPFTLGHKAIVTRALAMFTQIHIVVGFNSQKDGYFPVDKRVGWIEKVFKNEKKVLVTKFTGLTIDYCRNVGAKYILRGLRTSADFEYERTIAQLNRYMAPELESVFLLTDPELTPITSTIVREIIRYGGDTSKFLPSEIDLTE